MLVYLDSSVLVRAYLNDEDGHDDATRLIGGQGLLVTATLSLVETTSALVRAARSTRRIELDDTLTALHADVSPEGPIILLRTDTLDTENAARGIVRRFGIRALDALHLAVAGLVARPLAGDDEEVAFASRDDAQRSAAADLGFVLV